MNKNLALFIFLLAILITPIHLILAQDDLGVKDTGLLPTSRFYFLKEWIRNIEKIFTLNPVKKIELEADIANERLAEIKKLGEIVPENTKAIGEAIIRYQKNISQLMTRLEGLKETSENPNIDKLVDKLVDRGLKHQQLFDELRVKFEDSAELKVNFDSIENQFIKIDKIIFEKIDSVKKFKERIENITQKQKGELKEFKTAELIDRLEEELPEFQEKRKEISSLKEDLLLKFSARLEGQELIKPESLISLIKELPGDQLRRLKLLDEIREQVVNPDIKSGLNIIRQELLEKSKEKGLIKEEAAKTKIEEASKLIEEIDNLIAEREGDVTVSVRQLLERARFNLDSAKQALETGNPGNAFGQATAASAVAKNALKQLQATSEDAQNTLNILKARYDELISKTAKLGLTESENPKVFSFLRDSEKQILNLEQLISQKAGSDRINSLIQRIKFSLSTIEYFLAKIGEETNESR